MAVSVEIEVLAAPAVNFAMAHNNLRFIDRVVVVSSQPEPLDDVVLTIQLRDAAGVVITRPWTQHGSIQGSGRWVLDAPDVHLDPHYLAEVEEETAAEIIVSVDVGGETSEGELARLYTPIRIMAARQWHIDQYAPLLSVEVLASFVQPNHPAIAPVVAATAAHLAKQTGSGSLAVQDQKPERIDAIVEAAFQVVHDLGIFYSSPPASWGYGQKVRTPEDVLIGKLGTCLDTTLVLAAVLEQIGIAPVVWIARGHAFLGYWRFPDRRLPDAASLETASAINAVDLELMGVLETTMVTTEKRPPRDLFRRATQAPRDSYFHGRSSDLLAVLDVAEARWMKVLPVPARRVRSDGAVEVIEYQAAALPAAGLNPGVVKTDRATTRSAEPSAPPRVQQWKNALLDLTLRNPLLNMTYGMTQLPLVMPAEHLGVLADLLQDEKTVSIRALDDLTGAVASSGARDAYALPGDVQRAMLSNRSTIYSGLASQDHQQAITRLRYRARTTLQETGANPLFVTLGRLIWKLGDRELAAPLLLAPVDLKGVVQPFRIAFDTSGAVTLNLSLMEKLRHEFGLTIPALEELPQRSTGDGVDVDAVIRMVREAIGQTDLGFRVDSDARLVITQFTGYLLWRDLDQHWQQFAEKPLVKHLVETPHELFTGTPADPTQGVDDLDDVVAGCPIQADGSQAEAIAAARAGHSFVLEGPPGTGKSQTITNILADQLAQGRTVLFVAEKGAALDVVRTRLGHAGLLPFTLDLHDRNARLSEVRARLRSALAQRSDIDADGYRVSATDVKASSAALARYVDRVHGKNLAGLSLYEARSRQLARGAGPQLTVGIDALTVAGVEQDVMRRAVEQAVPALHEAQLGDDHPWGFARSGGDGARLGESLGAADRAVAEALAQVELQGLRAGEAVLSAATIDQLNAVIWLLTPGVETPSVLRETQSARWAGAKTELAGRMSRLGKLAEPILQSFAPEVASVALEPVRQALREAQASFFLGRKGRLVAAAAPVLAHLRPGASVPARQLQETIDQLASSVTTAQALAQSWRGLPGLTSLPADLNVLSPAGQEQLSAAVAALERDAALLASLPSGLADQVARARATEAPIDQLSYQTFRAASDRLAVIMNSVESRPADQHDFSMGQGILRQWAATAGGRAADLPRLASLRRWCDCIAALTDLEGTLPEARRELLTGRVAAADAPSALDRGLAAASVAERFEAGAFAGFDSVGQDRTAARFVSSAAALREELRTVLPAAVVDRRPFAAGAVFGQVGALEREVGRSRGGLTVRQLIERYGSVIAEVTPCVLVSPDSLARFVPPGSMTFDLVVFDEASQIRVADAIGALGRAHSVVVAGDSKQMPPSASFAESAEEVEADADFLVVPDEESILSECVQARVPRLWLSWHYRSRDESLIAFSNARYYEGRLSSFPAVPGQTQDTGLSFTRVDGHFHRSGEKGLLRTNPTEAAAVVAEVLRRWANRERSIGVVTFNLQQRNLIEQMLWNSGVEGVPESLAEREDGLFVKNLENVQGDERDVILFSTGFSANAQGILPLNFGPLNRSGGERRLNVAITRARQRVMMFSSFEPEDLRDGQTSSVGIKDLRAYLEMAKYGTPIETSAGRNLVDRHRDEIAEALRARDLVVDTGVGLSDFQVDLSVAPAGSKGRAALAVLLDSPVWAARRTTGDRDGLPMTVLHDIMGWPDVARVWLPAWLLDREAVLDDLAARAERAVNQPRTAGERIVSTARVELETDDQKPDDAWQEDRESEVDLADPGSLPVALRAGGSPDVGGAELIDFVPFEVVVRGGKGILDSAAYGRADRVIEVIREIVASEGPISVERLARLVVASYGITRLQAPRLAMITQLLPTDLIRDRQDGFIWPADRDPLSWQGFRRWQGPSKERPLEEVAQREIANAMVYLTRSAMGVGLEELLRETCRMFGGSRVTDPIRARLVSSLELAVRDGRLAHRAGVVTLP